MPPPHVAGGGTHGGGGGGFEVDHTRPSRPLHPLLAQSVPADLFENFPNVVRWRRCAGGAAADGAPPPLRLRRRPATMSNSFSSPSFVDFLPPLGLPPPPPLDHCGILAAEG